MFRHPLIWIQPSNRIDSTWLSTADCVWDGPQWLKSKQLLKLEVYLELEHLFKVFLRIPDASQTDVINDLLMLQSDRNVLRRQSTTYTKPLIGTADTPYEVIPAESETAKTEYLQSITCMEAYKTQSFEVKGSCRWQPRLY